MKNSELKKIFKERPYFDRPESVEGILQDALFNDKARANQLLIASNLGLVTALLESDLSANDIDKIKKQYTNRISKNYGFSDEIINDIVCTWINIIDTDTSNAYKEYKAIKLERDQKPLHNKPDFDELEITESIEKKITNKKAIKNYIPCDYGNSGAGFYIRGIKDKGKCKENYAHYFAVIYGILTMKLKYTPGERIEEFQRERKELLNLSNVYRLQIILLELIRNNYANKNCELFVTCVDAKAIELECAVDNINYLLKMLTCLAGDNRDFELRIASGSNKSNINIFVHGSTRYNNSVYIQNTEERLTSTRIPWHENNIKFNIKPENEDHIKIMHYLLSLGFGEKYRKFKEGQLDVITSMLNETGHKLCIMPTGAGKSLIYYFAAMLRSYPTFVVCPTEILIQDQLRNLEENHGIDDVEKLDERYSYREYKPVHKLIYLTPKVFIHNELLKQLKDINRSSLIGNIVLDEVHCISNWSHDFRPEYLMMSRNLTSFVDKTGYLCFTATANYTVIKDIGNQLNLKENQILIPEEAINNRNTFAFTKCESDRDIVNRAALYHERSIEQGRVISFTKNHKVSKLLYDTLSEAAKDDSDLYSFGDLGSYRDFAKEELRGLIADTDLGIGINLKNVNETIHVGLPLSKSQYVQEIGRSGRNGGKAKSNIFFIEKSDNPDINNLLENNLSIRNLLERLNNSSLEGDICDAYEILFKGIEDKDTFKRDILRIYDSIKYKGLNFYFEKNIKDKAEEAYYMRCLYVLFRLGFIVSWYIVDSTKDDMISIIISTINNDTYTEGDGLPAPSLPDVKEKAIEYLRSMGKFKREIRLVKEANDIEAVLDIYLNWFYEQFLYYHREQLLEMHDFCIHYSNSSDERILEALANYFSLSLVGIENNSEGVDKMSIGDISILHTIENASGIYNDISRSIESEYTYKKDFYIFSYNSNVHEHYDVSRLLRIIDSCTDEDRLNLLNYIGRSYSHASDDDKLLTINEFCKYYPIEDVVRNIYEFNDEDEVYYLILLLCFNKKWGF